MGGDIACVRVLIEAKADLQQGYVSSLAHTCMAPCACDSDVDGYTSVHCAAQYGHHALLAFLKLKGANMHALDLNKRSALHWAAYKVGSIRLQYRGNTW